MNDKTGNGNEKKNIFIMPEPAVFQMTLLAPSAWNMKTFSPQWFADALEEARNGVGENSIRREILFATCFLESYIFEWARGIDIEAIDNYFPKSRRYHPLKKKWDEVPRELYRNGKIGVEPQLDLSELKELVKIRNHLVHASISRPTQLGEKITEEAPAPAREVLRRLKAGWALSIAVSLVEQLHGQLRTNLPEYVEDWTKEELAKKPPR